MNMPESLFFILSTGTIVSWCFACGKDRQPDSTSYSLCRCFESLLVGDAGKTPTWQVATKKKVKECFAMTNWTK